MPSIGFVCHVIYYSRTEILNWLRLHIPLHSNVSGSNFCTKRTWRAREKRNIVLWKDFIDKSIVEQYCSSVNFLWQIKKKQSSVHSPWLWYIYIVKTTIYIMWHTRAHELWALILLNTKHIIQIILISLTCVSVTRPKICIFTQLNQQHFSWDGKTFAQNDILPSFNFDLMNKEAYKTPSETKTKKNSNLWLCRNLLMASYWSFVVAVHSILGFQNPTQTTASTSKVY